MDILECGKVLNTHGIRGEVKVDNYCDPGFFKKLRTVCIGGTEYAIRSARDHGAFVLLTLEGVETIEQAMPLKNKPITVRREQVRLEKGQYLYRDLYGFSVYDQRSGQTIGTLREVLARLHGVCHRLRRRGGPGARGAALPPGRGPGGARAYHPHHRRDAAP